MTGCVGALSASSTHDSTDISDPVQRMIASIRMIAKMPTMAAMAYKYSVGQPFIYPKNDLDYATNFLRMCFAVPCEDYKPNAVLARAMDRIFILPRRPSAECVDLHGPFAGSSGANPFACIAAGCACLWGPAHGGANEAALNMLTWYSARPTEFGIHSPCQGPERQLSVDGFSGIGSTNTTTLAPRSCRDIFMRFSTRLAPRMIPCWRSPSSSSGSRCTTIISSRRSCILISIFILASRSRPWASPPLCSPFYLRWHARWDGSRSGKR